MNKRLQALPWRLILLLGLVALIRPIIKILADFNNFEISPAITIIITSVIAAIWIGAVVIQKLRDPIITLAAAGAVYGIASIIIAVIIQSIAPESGSEEATIPFLLTIGFVATTLYNIVWGGLLGLIAKLIMKLNRK